MRWRGIKGSQSCRAGLASTSTWLFYVSLESQLVKNSACQHLRVDHLCCDTVYIIFVSCCLSQG